jgi:hypothetical protein
VHAFVAPRLAAKWVKGHHRILVIRQTRGTGQQDPTPLLVRTLAGVPRGHQAQAKAGLSCRDRCAAGGDVDPETEIVVCRGSRTGMVDLRAAGDSGIH